MSKYVEPDDELEDEYDFSKGVRGKYVERLKNGSNVVVLEPDVASKLDSPQAVNPLRCAPSSLLDLAAHARPR